MSMFARMPAVAFPPSLTRAGGAGAGGECWQGEGEGRPPPPPALRLQDQDDDLPLDPRVWGRAEVGRWVARGGGCAARFPMNGKALCLMTRAMFSAREPPRTALLLHQDFRRRLARALALQELIEEMTAKEV